MAIYKIKRFSFFNKTIFEKFENLVERTWGILPAAQYDDIHYPRLQVYKGGLISKDGELDWIVEIGYFGPCWSSLDKGKTWERIGKYWKKSELKTLTSNEFKVDLINQIDSFIKSSKNSDIKNYYTTVKQEVSKLNIN